MNKQILELIDEQKSPLFRIMSITNATDPLRRSFENNISAFHVGNGFILSVAHNLKADARIFRSIDEVEFQAEVLPHCTPIERTLLLKCYILDTATNKRNLIITDQRDVDSIITFIKRIRYDTRYITLYTKGIIKPYLIIQFNKNSFYNEPAVTALFDQGNSFPEPTLNLHTFLIEIELVEIFEFADIALYKIANTDPLIIAKIPTIKINFEIQELGEKIYCLQSSPNSSSLGRLFNEAKIEGLLDQHSVCNDEIGGNFFFTGLRYFLKCYFRFGSSGAPYFIYNRETEQFEVNAIQSQACPIQLTINNNMDGNFQYINAISTPLFLIKEDLLKLIN